jgi:peptidoglycan/LPS O-acetylase OafA/YrhL
MKLEKLEMARGAAAFYVFLGHFLNERILDKHGIIGFFLRFGQEAVMLFFILSGFVIYYSTKRHDDQSFHAYFFRRFSRIFPIFILALFCAFLMSSLGPGKFRLPSHISIITLGGNLLMLQDFSTGKPGVWFDTFCGDTALWSLSYEWWFYILFFPIYRFIPQRFQLPLVVAISLVGFGSYAMVHNQISLFLWYFILWWSGVELAKQFESKGRQPFSLQKSLPILFIIGGFTVLAIFPVLSAKLNNQSLGFGIHPILEFRHFLAAFMIISSALIWSYARWIGFEAIFGMFGWLAPISYALYVLHIPLACNAEWLDGLVPYPVEIISYIITTGVLVWFAEYPFQKWANNIIKLLCSRTRIQNSLFPIKLT